MKNSHFDGAPICGAPQAGAHFVVHCLKTVWAAVRHGMKLKK
jgi:hypothetical protein